MACCECLSFILIQIVLLFLSVHIVRVGFEPIFACTLLRIQGVIQKFRELIKTANTSGATYNKFSAKLWLSLWASELSFYSSECHEIWTQHPQYILKQTLNKFLIGGATNIGYFDQIPELLNHTLYCSVRSQNQHLVSRFYRPFFFF